MSQLSMNDPWLDPFYIPPRSRRRQANSLPPEEADSLLSQVASSAMGGLRMVGNVLDTPGSVVRGLVAGDTSRALAGVLDPDQRVSGREIIETYGLAAPNQEGLFNSVGDFAGDVAGFGAEVLLDPLTWVGGKALTSAGQAAEKSGALADLARTAGLEGKTWSAPIKAGYAGLLKVPGGVLGTGPTAQAVAEKVLDPLSELVRYGKYSPVPYVRGLLDHRAGDTYDPALQKLHEFVYLPTKEQLDAEALGNLVDNTARASQLGITRGSNLERTLADAGERIPVEAMDPMGLAVAEFGGDIASRNADLLDLERELGLPTRETEGYLARWRDPKIHGKRGATTWSGKQVFPTQHGAQFQREEILQDLSRNTVNDLVSDPALSLLTDPADRAAYVSIKYAGRSGIIGDDHALRLQDFARQNQGERFYGDMLVDAGTRELMSAKARAGAEAVHEGVKEMAFPIPTGAAPPPDAVPVREVFEKAGLGWQARNEKGIPMTGQGGWMDQFAQRMGIKPGDIGNYYVKAEDAAKLTKYAQSFTVPESVEPFLKVIDGLANVMRANLTSPFPSFHFRNRVTGAFVNWIDDAGYPTAAGVLDYVTPFRDADAIAKGGVIAGANAKFFGGQLADDAAATAQLAKEMFQFRAAGPTSVDQVTGSMVGKAASLPQGAGRIGLPSLPGEAGFVPRPGVLQSAWDAMPKSLEEANPLNVRGAKGSLDEATRFAPAREGEKWTQNIEWGNRASYYLAKRAQGYAPEIAAAQTRKAHFDYSALSKFEKKVMKRTALFYTFPRKNLPFMVEQYLKNPAKMAAATRGINAGQSESGFTPGWIGENTSIPVGPEQDGSRRWITGLGLPLEEAFGRFKFGPGGGERTAQSFAAMLRPELKVPLELFTGEQMFSGRPLRSLDPPIGRTVSNVAETLGLGPVDPHFMPPLVEQLAANSPLARFLSTARTVADPRKHGGPEDAAALLANLLTGIRVSDVDTARARQEAIEVLDKALLENPMIRQYQSVFLPKEFADMLDPRTQQLLELRKSLGR